MSEDIVSCKDCYWYCVTPGACAKSLVSTSCHSYQQAPRCHACTAILRPGGLSGTSSHKLGDSNKILCDTCYSYVEERGYSVLRSGIVRKTILLSNGNIKREVMGNPTSQMIQTWTKEKYDTNYELPTKS